jgi:predicted metal-dependent hydrolase
VGKVGYILKKSTRARSLRVSVYCDGRVVVAAPSFVGIEAVDRFVAQKSEWISRTLERFVPFRPVVRCKNSRAQYLKHKEAARELVMRRIPELNRGYGFKVGRIAIRNQKSRWGSCSARGNLNFNYRLALIPTHLADYVIVHELCHIAEMNHGPKFWALVAKTMPDYAKLRQELKGTRLSCI